nr:heavy metal sensor histidine kinase [uncultured Moellerella sp.]
MKRKSIRFKLTIIFTILMLVSLSTINFLLYNLLKQELVKRDESTLINRAYQMSQLISDGIDIKTLPMYFNRMMDSEQDIINISSKNTNIVEINKGLILPAELKTIKAKDLADNSIFNWKTEQGYPASAVKLVTQFNGQEILITLVRVAIERSKVLDGYLQKSITVSLIAIFITILFGNYLIKNGLIDLRILSKITQDTDIKKLNQQILIDDLPMELKALGNSMNIMRKKLAVDFLTLTQFSDDLAHELRTPINLIRVQNEITLNKKRSESDYIKLIQSNIEELDSLSNLIKNMLFIARAENKNIILNYEEIQLTELIELLCELFSPLLEEKNMSIHYDPVSVTLLADRTLLKRALLNIISNAIKYSEVDSLITIKVKPEKDSINITVSNEGMDFEDKNKLFTRLWRGDNARTTEGSGLGLAIVKAIMGLHKGEVYLDHSDNQNHITLVLPINY